MKSSLCYLGWLFEKGSRSPSFYTATTTVTAVVASFCSRVSNVQSEQLRPTTPHLPGVHPRSLGHATREKITLSKPLRPSVVILECFSKPAAFSPHRLQRTRLWWNATRLLKASRLSSLRLARPIMGLEALMILALTQQFLRRLPRLSWHTWSRVTRRRLPATGIWDLLFSPARDAIEDARIALECVVPLPQTDSDRSMLHQSRPQRLPESRDSSKKKCTDR